MRSVPLLTIYFVMLVNTVYSQQSVFTGSSLSSRTNRCGTVEHMEIMKQKDPGLEQRMREQRAKLAEFKRNFRQDPSQVVVIPVVIHVVYNTLGQRISEAQALSQIDVLNEDFSRSNPDTINTPSIFKSRAANTNIRFCLAKKDPAGNATTGINYIQTNVTSFSNDDGIKNAASGGADPWDVTKYFNIWVGNLSGSLLGYAEFPSAPLPSTYGVVISYKAFGRTGLAVPPYNLGRTATHEIGHCFYMFHIWGDEPACQNDDDISDTPMQKDNNFGCPTFPQDPSQPGGCCNPADVSSMFMNYMDYTDDNCMNLWTTEQASEMNAVLAFFAPTLLTSNVCAGSLDIADRSARSRLTVSPNPSDGKISIAYDMTNGNDMEFRIYNSIGKLMTSGAEHKREGYMELDLSSYPQGFYFIEARSGDKTATVKFTISR